MSSYQKARRSAEPFEEKAQENLREKVFAHENVCVKQTHPGHTKT